MTFLEVLFELQVPQTIKISPNTQQLVYGTTYIHGHKKGEHNVSTIWLAETGKKHSARQLTSGLYNDRDPKWSPDGNSIAFLSDRGGKQGESCAIYILPISGGGEAYPVTPAENEREITKFDFCPDGRSIAYLSADEKTPEQKRKDTEKDDANVWGQDWPFNRLRIVQVATKNIETVWAKDEHVVDFSWDHEGKKVSFLTVQTPNIESPFLHGTDIWTIDLRSQEKSELCHFPAMIENLTWCGEKLYFIGPFAETSDISARCVYGVDVHSATSSGKAWSKEAHGDEDCGLALEKAGNDIIVFVEHNMEDQLRILNGKILFSKPKKLCAWAAAFTKDSDEVVLAIAQGDTKNPTEVFSTTASGGAMVPLSNHGASFQDKALGTASYISCPTTDGKFKLECPWITPRGKGKAEDPSIPASPLPTVVLIHGGPYSRHNEAFDIMYFNWGPIILSGGYAILAVDYRGGSARGEEFASYGRGVGKYDYEDVISMTQHAIDKGYADPNRLVVAGWSQGGFLSYICSVRNGTHGHGWKFQAAIPGAGVADEDTMCYTSDIGSVEGEMGFGEPWKLSHDDIRNRQCSAIWEFGDAIKNGIEIPPMLILHGEKDERVPLEQGVAFRRAMASAKLPFEFVSYPREPHIIGERRHLVDMGERVLRWLDRYLS